MYSGGDLLGSFSGPLDDNTALKVTGTSPQIGQFVLIQTDNIGKTRYLSFREVKVFGSLPQSLHGENSSKTTNSSGDTDQGKGYTDSQTGSVLELFEAYPKLFIFLANFTFFSAAFGLLCLWHHCCRQQEAPVEEAPTMDMNMDYGIYEQDGEGNYVAGEAEIHDNNVYYAGGPVIRLG